MKAEPMRWILARHRQHTGEPSLPGSDRLHTELHFQFLQTDTILGVFLHELGLQDASLSNCLFHYDNEHALTCWIH